MDQRLINIPQVRAAVQTALRYVCEHTAPDERAGGYFGLLERGVGGVMGAAVILEQVGIVAADQLSLYFNLVREKPNRLSQHPGHLSSHQSRDPDRNQWGGAIAAGAYYLSFSGLSELADEALVLIVARQLELLSDREAMRIAGLSQNALFFRWARASHQ